MKISYFLGILVQLWIVQAFNETDVVRAPRAEEPTEEPETPVWYYLPIVVGVLALLTVIVVLYMNGKRRAMRRRRRRAERQTMHISVPVEGTLTSLMGNASVDVVAVNARPIGNPQLKTKMLQTFNDEESLSNSFENYNDDGSDDALGALEDYINTKGLDYGQDSRTSVSQPNFKGNQNVNTNMLGKFENGASKKVPFIPPAISVELVRKQSEKDSQIERGNRNKNHGALLPDWGHRKEELVYENQNSASVRAAKSFENFREQGQQPLYVNNTQAFLMKKEKSGEHFNKNQPMPELPLKRKLRRTDGLEAQTKTWEKGRSSNYENVFGGEGVGGSWQRGAVYQKNKNRAYVVGQGTKSSNLKDGPDYENAPSFGGKLLAQKTQMAASCGSQGAPKVTSHESRRRGAGFTREDNKAVRRSRSNVDAMLQPAVYTNEGGHYGQGALESKESISSDNHQTNTESLMHLLGLPINLSCSDQVNTCEDDYLPMDDYDDNQA
ncbi:uncharacterized protein LOC116288706 [Actinia tenebrosa]|uniref:Uncharacterized protein LOC116288706 n=1 Tax=Actinia tenebrosa TaxID=6105 RepID=A0A6P8HFN5_ACTTE|nr:uncharacterized protein LOC116288706 [Actinia tenebrosa]